MTETLLNEVDGVATLNGAIVTAPAADTVETWTFTTLPVALRSGTWRAKLDGATETGEIIKVTPSSSTSASVVRAQEGTTAVTYPDASVFIPLPTVAALRQAISEAGTLVAPVEITGSVSDVTVGLLKLTNTDGGATGARVVGYSNSASPGANDVGLGLDSYHNDSIGTKLRTGRIHQLLESATNGAVEAWGFIDTMKVNALQRVMQWGSSGFIFRLFGAAEKIYVSQTDNGATGVVLQTDHISTSPAPADIIHSRQHTGRDSGANSTVYGREDVSIVVATDGTEQGQFTFYVNKLGALQRMLDLYNGGVLVNLWSITELLHFIQNDPGALGVEMIANHASASPAIGDAIFVFQARGRNLSAVEVIYGQDSTTITDQTAGSEDATRAFGTIIAGVLTTLLSLSTDGVVLSFTNGTTQALRLTTVDNGAAGVQVVTHHNSGSPAASDVILNEDNYGNNTTPAAVTMFRQQTVVEDVTPGSEDARRDIYAIVAGVLTKILTISGSGLVVSRGGLIVPELAASPTTPASGFGEFYANSEGLPYFKSDGAQDMPLGGTAVMARYKTAAGQSITSGVATAVNFDSMDYDVGAAVTTGAAWQYLVPVAGKYTIAAMVTFASSANWAEGEYSQVSVYKNGAQLAALGIQAGLSGTSYKSHTGSTTVDLLAGDVIQVYVHSTSGSTETLFNSAPYNWITVQRVAGTALPMGDAQAIVARYTTVAGQSIANNAAAAIINFGTLDYDPSGVVTVGASWKFTAPVTGYYSVKAAMLFAGSTAWAEGEFGELYLYKNGVRHTSLWSNQSAGANNQNKVLGGATTLLLTAADYVDLRVVQNSGGALALDTTATWNWVAIEQVAGATLPRTNPALVAARYKTSAGQSITTSTVTIINFGTMDWDTSSAVTTGAAWKFTAPAEGYYRVATNVLFAISAGWAETEDSEIYLYKNGVALTYLDIRPGLSGNQQKSNNSSTTVYLLAGDYIDLRIYQNSGGTIALTPFGEWNWIAIEQIGGVALPQTLPQWVGARAITTAGQSIPNATDTIVDFGTVQFDTHAKITTGAAWKFTAPTTGYYLVAAKILYNTTTAWAEGEGGDVVLYKNGSIFAELANGYGAGSAAQYKGVGGSTLVSLAAGDYIDVRASQASGGALTLYTGPTGCHISISLVSANIPNQGIPLGAWTDWVPVVTQSATPTTTVNSARYMQVGKIVYVQAKLTFGSAGTAANGILMTLPVAAKFVAAEQQVGSAWYFDSGSAYYVLAAMLNSTSQLRFFSNAGTNLFGVNPAITIASPDSMTVDLVYEAA